MYKLMLVDEQINKRSFMINKTVSCVGSYKLIERQKLRQFKPRPDRGKGVFVIIPKGS